MKTHILAAHFKRATVINPDSNFFRRESLNNLRLLIKFAALKCAAMVFMKI